MKTYCLRTGALALLVGVIIADSSYGVMRDEQEQDKAAQQTTVVISQQELLNGPTTPPFASITHLSSEISPKYDNDIFDDVGALKEKATKENDPNALFNYASLLFAEGDKQSIEEGLRLMLLAYKKGHPLAKTSYDGMKAYLEDIELKRIKIRA